jgi:hypothetical protein
MGAIGIGSYLELRSYSNHDIYIPHRTTNLPVRPVLFSPRRHSPCSDHLVSLSMERNGISLNSDNCIKDPGIAMEINLEDHHRVWTILLQPWDSRADSNGVYQRLSLHWSCRLTCQEVKHPCGCGPRSSCQRPSLGLFQLHTDGCRTMATWLARFIDPTPHHGRPAALPPGEICVFVPADLVWAVHPAAYPSLGVDYHKNPEHKSGAMPLELSCYPTSEAAG